MFTADQFRAKAGRTPAERQHGDSKRNSRIEAVRAELPDAGPKRRLARRQPRQDHPIPGRPAGGHAGEKRTDDGPRDRGAYPAMPRRGRRHAVEHDPGEAPARAVRHRRVARRGAQNDGAAGSRSPASCIVDKDDDIVAGEASSKPRSRTADGSPNASRRPTASDSPPADTMQPAASR